jgi:hypothetical protein
MAAADKLPDRDVAPLFEIFQKYGDASAVTELTKATDQWNYYAVVALAQLPEGAGIPALIDLAESPGGARLNALEMLAQVSTQSPEAHAALLESARSNKISPNYWPYLTPLLAGDQYHFETSVLDNLAVPQSSRSGNAGHVESGNQNFYTTPPAGGLSQERINEQNDLIDELLVATTEPAALQALELAKNLLFRRASQAVVVYGQ